MIRIATRLVAALVLSGCAPGASHLGNPLTLPARAIGASLGNASYDARRARVSDHVIRTQAQILAGARAGGGPALSQAMHLAAVPAARRAALIAEITRGAAHYATDAEALLVAIMVHGG